MSDDETLTVDDLEPEDELLFRPGAWRYEVLAIDAESIRLRTESGNPIEFSRVDFNALLERETIERDS
jgi:hypothetical protein